MNPHWEPVIIWGFLELFYHKIFTMVPWNLYNYLLHVAFEEPENQVTEVISERLTADWWQSPEPGVGDVDVWRNRAPCLQRFWCNLSLLGLRSTDSWQNYGRLYLVCDGRRAVSKAKPVEGGGGGRAGGRKIYQLQHGNNFQSLLPPVPSLSPLYNPAGIHSCIFGVISEAAASCHWCPDPFALRRFIWS